MLSGPSRAVEPAFLMSDDKVSIVAPKPTAPDAQVQTDTSGAPLRKFLTQPSSMWDSTNRVGIRNNEHDTDQRTLVSIASQSRINNMKVSYEQKFLWHYRPTVSPETFMADTIEVVNHQFNGFNMDLQGNREWRSLLQDINRLSRMSTL